MFQKHWKTLRFRLASWNAAIVVLTAMITLGGLRQGVEWALLHEMDQILEEDLEEIELALKEQGPQEPAELREELNRKAIGHQHHGWFVQMYGPDHQLVWASIEAPEGLVPSNQLPLGPSTAGEMRVVQAQVSVTPNGEVPQTVRVGASLALLRQDLSQIDRLVILSVALVLIVAPLIGYWLAGKMTRRIGKSIQTAARLRPSHLEERLPIRGTGDELDQLAETVNSLLDRIAEYLQQRRDFLANAAHELRTPLTAIRSSVEVTLSSARTNQEYEDQLVEIIEQSSSLEYLVNQLLLISESEVEQLSHSGEVVMFDQIVQRSVDMFAGVAETREITLKSQVAPQVPVLGKRHLLSQVVNNLIDNALKYTSSGGEVFVELSVSREEKQVSLTVRDTGSGIPPDDVGKIFDRFFRADRSRQRNRETVGTGLGLSICQAIVQAHLGQIACESELGVGTEMRVQLPLAAQEEAAATRTGRSGTGDSSQMKEVGSF
ncbi:MAG: HAMP domain-containing histidine kinase [Planctomycetaceae bacterium]|nr:HAMP domain-containing histidine kinase [Planctomycetaceae bacterium]